MKIKLYLHGGTDSILDEAIKGVEKDSPPHSGCKSVAEITGVWVNGTGDELTVFAWPHEEVDVTKAVGAVIPCEDIPF